MDGIWSINDVPCRDKFLKWKGSPLFVHVPPRDELNPTASATEPVPGCYYNGKCYRSTLFAVCCKEPHLGHNWPMESSILMT
jgi:hypothetical protein